MKYGSKIICFLLLIACHNMSLGMRRLTQFKPMAQTNTVQISPSLYTRFQQALRNTWTHFTNRFFKTPTITTSQLIALPTTQKTAFYVEPTTQKPKDLIPLELKAEVQKVAAESSIECPDPTEEIKPLLQMKSLFTFEKYIKNKKRSVFIKMGFTKEEINEIEHIIESNLAQFMLLYKQAKKYSDHDQTIPADQLDIAYQLLKKLSLHPSSIPIQAMNPIDKSLGKVRLELKTKEITTDLDDFINNIPSFMEHVIFLKPIQTPALEEVKTFVIAHEIGHVLKGHIIERFIIGQLLKHRIKPRAKIHYSTKHQQSQYEKKIDLLYHKELFRLHEIEADIWMATKYQILAEIMRKATLQGIKAEVKRGEIYLTPEENFYLLTKIIQLHQEDALKNQSTADTTKE